MSIVPRGDRFGARTWDRGTRKWVWHGTFSTREEALEAERTGLLKAGEGSPTVREWAGIWLSDYARPAAATRMVYRQATNRVIADLGALRMGEVDRRRARECALSWPRNVSAVARTMWGDAVRDGVVRENPWTNMRLKQSRGRKETKALSETEVLELADLATETWPNEYGQEMRALILTLGFVGIRPGELCALRWEDLQLAQSEMRIARSLDATGKEKRPKNNWQRVVTVPPIAGQALNALPRSLDGYVFHSFMGQRLTKANLFYAWKDLRARWIGGGHAPVTPYDLRHACATLLLERGLDAASVAIQLGHRDGGALILSTYGHPDEARARERLKMAFSEAPASIRRRAAG